MPVIAVSGFVSLDPDQVTRCVPAPYAVLGTDGFGRSDTREPLRRHFEVDATHVILAVLGAPARSGAIDPSTAPRRWPVAALTPKPSTRASRDERTMC